MYTACCQRYLKVLASTINIIQPLRLPCKNRYLMPPDLETHKCDLLLYIFINNNKYHNINLIIFLLELGKADLEII
jgi:hypothetical protein